MFNRLAAFATCLVVICAATAASANLSIDKLWVEFTDGRPGRSDVVIRNDSDDRYYIDVTVAEILNPGTEAEERVTIADPEARGLLVTPNRLVLEPGALRSIRLVSLNENLSHDRIYRVMIKPEVGVIQSDAPVLEGSPNIVMKLMAAYDVLVIARPKGGKAQLDVVRNGHELTLTNKGTSNILIAEGTVCPRNPVPKDQEAQCTAIEAQRLYAGNAMTIPMAASDDIVKIKSRETASGSMSETEL
ncbi:MAG: hypothetical protein P0Y52_02155 [Candidatus Brevundimonas phytovorans]|nr:hypothetical protein [Brevundimonas sp.]WEK58365.1 MAG: hypothetical protein P0Y52_02155 [Brevundimonas sp.]